MAMVASQTALNSSTAVAIAANQNRTYLEVKNLDTAIIAYIGHTSSVTTSTGYPLAAGATFGFSNMSDAVYVIAASGTPTLAAIEWSR